MEIGRTNRRLTFKGNRYCIVKVGFPITDINLDPPCHFWGMHRPVGVCPSPAIMLVASFSEEAGLVVQISVGGLAASIV